MVASAYDETYGFSVGNQLGALLKRAVIQRARKVVMMLDGSKAGGLLPFTFANSEDVDVLVTDDGFSPQLKKKLEGKIPVVI